MYLWLKRKVSQSSDAHIDQVESRMLDHHVTTAPRAITPVAHVAAFESGQELGAFGDIHVFIFPQCKRAHRGGRITPAVFTMAVAHLQWITARLDLHRSTVTLTCMHFRHRCF